MKKLLIKYFTLLLMIQFSYSCSKNKECDLKEMDYICAKFNLSSDLMNNEIKLGDPIRISIAIPETIDECDGKGTIRTYRLKKRIPLVFKEFSENTNISSQPSAINKFTYNIINGNFLIDASIKEDAIVLHQLGFSKQIEIIIRPHNVGIFMIYTDSGLLLPDKSAALEGDICEYFEDIRTNNISVNNKDLLIPNNYNGPLETYISNFGLLAFKVVQ